MNGRLGRLLGGGAYLYAGGLGTSALALVQGIIVARALGPANYGIWGVALATCALTQALLGFRTTEPLTRYLVELRDDGRPATLVKLLHTAFLTDLATRTVAILVVVAVSPLVAATVAGGADALPVYFIVAATTVLSSADAVWYCVVRDRREFRLLAGLPLAFTAFQVLAVAACWLGGWFDLVTLAIVYTAVAAVRFVAKLAHVVRLARSAYAIELVARPSVGGFRGELAGFWRFMGMTYVSSVISALVKNGDMLILGYFRPENEVGWYRLARNMASLIHNAASSLAEVAYQDLSELVAARRFARLRRELLRVTRVWVPLVLAGMCVAFLVAGPVIRFVYGDDYAASTRSFHIFILGVGVAMMLFWTRPLGLAMEKLRAHLAVVVVSSVFFVLAGILLVPAFGQYGMAASMSGTWAVGHLGMLWVVWR